MYPHGSGHRRYTIEYCAYRGASGTVALNEVAGGRLVQVRCFLLFSFSFPRCRCVSPGFVHAAVSSLLLVALHTRESGGHHAW